MVVSFTGSALADSFDNQINALKVQLAQQQAQANALSAVANDYQSRVNQLNAQIGALQAQINLNQAQYDNLVRKIAEAAAKLENQKQVLSANLKSMYLSSDVTPLEMVASSNNLSQYFDQQQYQDSIKNKIKTSMDGILALQKQLTTQREDVNTILVSLNTQRNQLATNRDEVNQLLAAAAANANAANQMVKDSNAQINSLRAQQAAAIAAAMSSGDLKVSGGGCGPYPDGWCHSVQDSVNTIYGYPSRECTSYAAWRRYSIGKPLGGNWGDAWMWASHGNDNGPHVGDVIVWPRGHRFAGPYGHVAVIEVVNGTTVTYSQYNFNYGAGWGLYSLQTTSSVGPVLTGVTYIR